MRATPVVNLLFIITVGNILYAAQEVASKKQVESGLAIIESLTDLKNRAKTLVRSKFFELPQNTKISEFKIPKNIQVSPKVIDYYLYNKMGFQEEFECVCCRYQTCNCNKKTLAEYIQDRSPGSYKNLSDRLIVIFCLKGLKVLEDNESRKQRLKSAKFKIKKELNQQLNKWIGSRRRDELRANEREGYLGLIALLASTFFIGYYVCGC